MTTLPSSIERLRLIATDVAETTLAAEAERVDAEAAWPERGLRAIADAGLLGLHVPQRLGGREEGMLALVVLTEALARQCPSTALCYGMHCVASAVLAAKSTPHHDERYLRPIAAGTHFTTLALSEAGTGAHFYWPQTHLLRADDHYVITGTKQFVTSGGHADSYVVTTTNADPGSGEAGEFSALVLDEGTAGMDWTGDWRGFGMRGNSSRAMRLDGVRVPVAQLLGSEGDEVWYVFEVIAPYFLMAVSGVYLGIASAALEMAVDDVKQRSYAHTGQSLSAESAVQHNIAELWLQVQQACGMVRHAASLADVGDPGALPALLGSKIAATTAAIEVANRAMGLGGGRAYRENGRLGRLLRDARAGDVMAPTTDMLKSWLGRSALGLPML